MASRVKEEDRIERIIRGLLKLPENKRCINCNSLGPQYVCTTFWTFVCTTCSGIHREFTHRVKSVSMAKFTAEEVSALQAGGNERARQIYLKAWDPQRHSFPDGSNQSKLREYIKHVYVDRKYAGDRNADSLPLVKLNKQNENYGRKPGTDNYGRHGNERPGSGGRADLKYYHDEYRSSPRYTRDNSRSGGYKRSPIRIEVVDDRFRDDGNARGRRSDPRRTSSVEVMARSQSPVPQKNHNRSMSPVIRPVGDLLGDNVPQLQVGETVKGGKSAEASTKKHDLSPSPVAENKNAETSLIDFDMDPKPSTSKTITEKGTTKEAPSDPLYPSASENHSRAQSITTLESLLFELNVPTDASPVNAQLSENSDVTSTVLSRDMSAPAGDAHVVQCTLEPANNVTSDADHSINVPIPPMLQSASDDQSENVTLDPPYHSLENDSISQQSASYTGTDSNQGQSINSLEKSVEAFSFGGPDLSSITVPNTPAEEARATRINEPPPRKELPADLFALSYPPAAGWQTGQPHAMSFGMHYPPTAYQVTGFSNSFTSTNPFDIRDTEGSQPDQSKMFPLMPTVSAPPGFLNPPPPVHGNQLGPHSLYSSALSDVQLGHHPQPPTDSPIGPQGFGAGGGIDFDFGSLVSTQPASYNSSAPTTQKSLPSTGTNPFE